MSCLSCHFSCLSKSLSLSPLLFFELPARSNLSSFCSFSFLPHNLRSLENPILTGEPCISEQNATMAVLSKLSQLTLTFFPDSVEEPFLDVKAYLPRWQLTCRSSPEQTFVFCSPHTFYCLQHWLLFTYLSPNWKLLQVLCLISDKMPDTEELVQCLLKEGKYRISTWTSLEMGGRFWWSDFCAVLSYWFFSSTLLAPFCSLRLF